MSKPLAKFTVTVSSTTAREREVTVTAVLLRLRPRLAQAMDSRDTPPRPFFVLRLMVPPSVYRTASMGETLAAARPGFRQERSTVTRENSAAPMKITGLTEVTGTIPSSWDTMAGVIWPPMNQPAISPRGMPARDSVSACWRMIQPSCRGVVPMVFSRP